MIDETVQIPQADETRAPAPAVRRSRRFRHPYWTALRTGRGAAGAVILVILVILGLVGGLLLRHGPLEQGASALSGPSGNHLLGTDEVGRDLLARLVSGLRLDLFIILIAVPVSAVSGTLLGLVGMVNEFTSSLFQRIFDVLLGLPNILLGVIIAIILNPGRVAVVVAIVLSSIPVFGRQSRNGLVAQRSLEYVTAARVLGASNWRILRRHVMPNIMDALIVRTVTTISEAIKIEGGLSVVGLGIQPPQASLGSMIKSGGGFLFEVPLYALAPVAVIVALIAACTLLSDALNTTFNRR